MNSLLSRRRQFLKQCLTGSSLFAMTTIPLPRLLSATNAPSSVRFGVITDVHKDIIHDADQRLQTFVDEMSDQSLHFIAQLGDFCIPKVENSGFLEIWNRYRGPRFHVLGNHDMDGGYSRDQAVTYLGMPDRYYAFEQGPIQFIVLDGNDRPEDHTSGYPRYIAADQQEWLRAQLEQATKPVIVFSHQSLENKSGVQNGNSIRKILETANQSAGFRKVLACFSGHHHRDYVRQINNIVYPQINSASYFWVGSNFQQIRYSPAIDKKFPYIKYTVPYQSPLFATVEIDLKLGFMRILGRQSEFVGPAPWELGETKEYWNAETLSASVSSWKMPI